MAKEITISGCVIRESESVIGVIEIRPKVFKDPRGFFVESYNQNRFAEAGIPSQFVQDNHSRSSLGTLRGLHFQIPPYAQAKLVRIVGEGKVVMDVAADIDPSSPTFGKHHVCYLEADAANMLFVPRGMAHGFCVPDQVGQSVDFLYKVDAPYSGPSSRGIIWNDPTIAIPWPTAEPLLSDQDKLWPTLQEALPELRQIQWLEPSHSLHSRADLIA